MQPRLAFAEINDGEVLVTPGGRAAIARPPQAEGARRLLLVALEPVAVARLRARSSGADEVTGERPCGSGMPKRAAQLSVSGLAVRSEPEAAEQDVLNERGTVGRQLA
jgi:hypothetical protein